MAEVTPGSQQKAQQFNLAKNRQGREGSGGNVAGQVAEAVTAPQLAAVSAVANKVAPGLVKALKLDNKGIRMVWKVLLWTLPLSAPLILMFLLLLILMLLL